MSRAVVDEAPFPLPGTPEALAAAEERFGPLFPQVYERELEHCAPAVAYEYARRECMAQPHERERRERQAREDEARRQRERERERKQWEAKLAEPEWAAAIAQGNARRAAATHAEIRVRSTSPDGRVSETRYLVPRKVVERSRAPRASAARPRPRGAGRPRAAATSSSQRSGDSGSDSDLPAPSAAALEAVAACWESILRRRSPEISWTVAR